MAKITSLLLLFAFTGCFSPFSPKQEVETSEFPPWPKKVSSLPTGLTVVNDPSTVYATDNEQNPEKFQFWLRFATTVTANDEDLEIVEFGVYLLEEGRWEFRSLYDRPFEAEEFDRWYGGTNGQIRLGESYSDANNWIAKGNSLDGGRMDALLYFIAKNQDGEEFVGASQVVGYRKHQSE